MVSPLTSSATKDTRFAGLPESNAAYPAGQPRFPSASETSVSNYQHCISNLRSK